MQEIFFLKKGCIIITKYVEFTFFYKYSRLILQNLLIIAYAATIDETNAQQ